jgi:phosphate/sulfate permease
MWLVQDLANIYVYLPRKLDLPSVLATLVLMCGLQAWIFYTRGGEIQKIVLSKTNTQDIRSATIIDFLYATILALFADGTITWLLYGRADTLPMSTTWVFLGVLAGRELAMNVHLKLRSWQDLGLVLGGDVGRAGIGLAVSVVVALLLPYLATAVGGAVSGTTPAVIP